MSSSSMSSCAMGTVENLTSVHSRNSCVTRKRFVRSCLSPVDTPNFPSVQSKLTQDLLKVIFDRYASPVAVSNVAAVQTLPSEPLTLPMPQAPATELMLDGFSDFLFSQDNTAFSESSTGLWQDMSQPISSYYISTSHNTYLVGNQLVGVSTVEGYIRALLHSCRSVECKCLRVIAEHFTRVPPYANTNHSGHLRR